MKRTLIATLLLGVFLTLSAVAQKPSTPEAQLGAIINQAEVEGKFDAAIPAYKKFLADNSKNKALAAKAEFHLGVAYEKLGNPEARRAYQDVVTKYPDQPAAAEAGRHLQALGGGAAGSGSGAQATLVCRDDLGLIKTDAVPACHGGENIVLRAAVSWDGRFMAVSNSDGLAIRNLTSGEVVWPIHRLDDKTPLTDQPDVLALSPDGRYVAYESLGSSAACDASHFSSGPAAAALRIVPTEPDGKPRTLIPCDPANSQHIWPAAWSPDGKSILVSIGKPDQTWQIAWVSVANGEVKPIRSLGWRAPYSRPSLSFDGRYIAYAAAPAKSPNDLGERGRVGSVELGLGNFSTIYVVAADGSGAESAVVTGANPTGVPDAKAISNSIANSIAEALAAFMAIPESLNTDPVWTPDGNILFFKSTRTAGGTPAVGLWSVGVKDGRSVTPPVPVKPDIGLSRAVSVSQLGATVSHPASAIGMTHSGAYYYAQKHSTEQIVIQEVITQTQSGGNSRPISLAERTNPSWSPDGKQIASFSGDSLLVYSVSTGDPKKYDPPAEVSFQNAAKPLWFHDGRAILQVAARIHEKPALYRIDLKSRDYKKIAAAPLGGQQVFGGALGVLSSNDKTLYMIGSAVTPAAGATLDSIIAVDMSSGQWKTVATVPEAASILLSPNDKIAYVKACAPPPASSGGPAGAHWAPDPTACHRVVAVDLSSGTQQTVLTVSSPEAIGDFAVSPDSRKLALVISNLINLSVNGTFGVVPRSKSRLVQIGVDGSAPLKLYETETSDPVLRNVSWTGDGKAVVVMDSRSQRQLRVPIDGRGPEFFPITPMVPQPGNPPSRELSLDGTHIATTVSAEVREVRKIDNVSALLKSTR